MKIRLRYILASLVLHLLLLFIVLAPQSKSAHQKKYDAGSSLMTIELIEMDKGYSLNPLFCKGKNDFYQGIGITYNPESLVITAAPASYPAYKAGIRVGDGLDSVPYDEDGYAFVTLYRGDQKLSFKVKMEKICYEH